MVEGPLPAAEILLLAKQMPLRVSNKAVTDPKTAAAQGSGMMNSPARAFGHMMAGLMKGMGSYRAEPSPKVTILDTPKAAPQPRLLALEDARPEPPVLPAKSTDTPAGGVGRTTTVAQEVDAQIGGESIEENLLNLRKSLSGADEDKEAAAMKRPASKRLWCPRASTRSVQRVTSSVRLRLTSKPLLRRIQRRQRKTCKQLQSLS